MQVESARGEELDSNRTWLYETPQLVLRAAAVAPDMSASSAPKYRWCGPQGHNLLFGVAVAQHGNDNNDKLVVHTEVRQSCRCCCRSFWLLACVFLWRSSMNLLPTLPTMLQIAPLT